MILPTMILPIPRSTDYGVGRMLAAKCPYLLWNSIGATPAGEGQTVAWQFEGEF